MKTFTSLSDLDKLSDDDPARPIIKQLLEWLIVPPIPTLRLMAYKYPHCISTDPMSPRHPLDNF